MKAKVEQSNHMESKRHGRSRKQPLLPRASSIKKEFCHADKTSGYPLKGNHVYSVEVNGDNKDAAWYYADPKPAAKEIKDHVAF
jgi:uncharacterized protein (DUF427 family)